MIKRALQFYNTLTRKKEAFKPINDGEVSIYSCGPTVYANVHIGNLRAFIFADLLRRYLKYRDYKLNHVMNITDVDDKTIRDSQKEGKSLNEFTKHYTKLFLKDIKTLNIEIPEHMPKATDCIKDMVALILKLKEKGFAYEKKGNWYFSIAKFKDYGKLAKLDIDNLKQNADGRLNDSDEYEKDDVRDFALWKAYEEKDGDVFWDTELGKGRPGWHIECSVMSTKYLGDTFDIHTGGVDLIFPHHTNEIAQSEAATGKKFVNYWLHNAHLIVNGEKMSKSLGNFFTLHDLLDKGYDSKAIRYELMATHYRQKLDFREDNLKKIPDTLQKFYDFLNKLDECNGSGFIVDSAIKDADNEFKKAMDDDLNISGGLAAVFNFMTGINKVMDSLSKEDASKVKKIMLKFDSVLGVMEHEKVNVSEEVLAIVRERDEARKNKNFTKSDELRDKIKDLGFVLEDTDKGARVKKV